MSSNDCFVFHYTQLTASALVPANFVGRIVCSSSTAGTLKIWDNNVASGAVLLDTVSLTAGATITLDAAVQNKLGVFLTIGGTASITFLWN